MTLKEVFLHVFRTRNFGGLLAATVGCMLGGSLLLVGLTTLVGFLHESLYAAILLQALFGGLVLGVYAHVAKQAYESREARGLKPAALLFARIVLLTGLMPLTILLALYGAWCEARSVAFLESSLKGQKNPSGSWTAQIGRYYGRMAHIA